MNIIQKIKEYLNNKTEKRVRAIIIEDGKVLLMHRIVNGQEYWVFPGGGIEEFDITPEEGLKRECKEELGVEVEVKDIFISKQSSAPNSIGQMEYFYNCKILSGKVGTGNGPEWSGRDIEKYGTYEVVWIPISLLKDKTVYPFEVRDKIIL